MKQLVYVPNTVLGDLHTERMTDMMPETKTKKECEEVGRSLACLPERRKKGEEKTRWA